MRRQILALPLLALAAPAMAQADTEAELGRMARTMGDPARQEALARAMGAMTEVLLDLPLAPLIGPFAEAAGEDPGTIDRDATLRKMSPAAGAVPRQIERQLPRAMSAMARMSGAVAVMLPQLREATQRMRDALPAIDLSPRP